MRLLIVDDDASLRMAMQLVFEDAGHEVFQATSATEARSMIQGLATDVVLIDAGLSDGGLNLWRELQMNAAHEGRALLLTGNVQALGALGGHSSVFAKPFDYDILLDRIESVGTRAHDDLRGAGGQ